MQLNHIYLHTCTFITAPLAITSLQHFPYSKVFCRRLLSIQKFYAFVESSFFFFVSNLCVKLCKRIFTTDPRGWECGIVERVENDFTETFELLAHTHTDTCVNKLTKRFRCWKTFIVRATPTSSTCIIHEAAHTQYACLCPCRSFCFRCSDNRRSIS